MVAESRDALRPIRQASRRQGRFPCGEAPSGLN